MHTVIQCKCDLFIIDQNDISELLSVSNRKLGLIYFMETSK